MIKFIPYTEDPFLQPPLYRVVPLEQTDMGYYTLFIKNLIAALFYQDFTIKTFPYHRETPKNQAKLLDLYMKGELRIWDDYFGLRSPLIHFQKMELKNLIGSKTPEVVIYLNFLERYTKVFQSIDRAVDYDFDNDIIGYDTYIHNKMGKIHYFKTNEIRTAFKYIKFDLVLQLKKQLIANLNIKGLDFKPFKEDLDALNFHFSNEFVDSNEMYRIKHHSVIWFGQLLRKIGFEIGWHDYKDFFDEMKSQFYKAINYQPPVPEIANIPYPKHIFTDPKAYLLFHEIASKTSKNIIISYLFRRMGEKENFISVRDTEFRDWFNTAGYPKELYSPTHTYEKSYTEERELFVNLLYEKYGLGE